jgi:hypothetical protein
MIYYFLAKWVMTKDSNNIITILGNDRLIKLNKSILILEAKNREIQNSLIIPDRHQQ